MAQPHLPRGSVGRIQPEFRGVYVAPRTRNGGHIPTRYNCICGCKGKLLLVEGIGAICQAELDRRKADPHQPR
jgi:hypothetical protein